MKFLIVFAAVACVASAGLIGAPAAIVRAPAFDSAVIKSDRIGGNFAYSTAESHAYAAVSPVISQVATPVAVSYSAPVVQHVAHAAYYQAPAYYHAPAFAAAPAYTFAAAPAVVSPIAAVAAVAEAPAAPAAVEDAAPAESAPVAAEAAPAPAEPAPAAPASDDTVSVEAA